MKRHCFRDGRAGDCAPFLRAMMRQDHVDQHLDFLFVVVVLGCEALNQRSAHVQMPEKHSAGCERSIAGLGSVVLSDLCDIMDRGAAHEKFSIQRCIYVADRICRLDHAVGVVKQPAAQVVVHGDRC